MVRRQVLEGSVGQRSTNIVRWVVARIYNGSGNNEKQMKNGHNDNDNDTLREVPHLSDEGLALQARASGPWPH